MSTASPQSHARIAPWRGGMLGAWGVLVLTLAASMAAWWYVRVLAEDRARSQLESAADDLVHRIDRRMVAYEQILHAGAAFFAASKEVTRAEWRDFVDNLRLDEHFPGVQGVGFAQRVPGAELARHEASMRAQGLGNYAVWPQGERDPYTAIVYIEPFSGRNLRALGYDMYSEPLRRAAMDRAASLGNAALSGKVTLVQETEREPQAGFLMYVPVYARPIAAAAKPRLLGWTYAPFRAGDFMRALLGSAPPIVDFELFDGDAIDESALLFDLGETRGFRGPTPEFWRRQSTLTVAGRTWTLILRPQPAFLATQTVAPRVVIVAGLAISMLLFALALLLASQRQRALALAADLNADLQRAHDELETRVRQRSEEVTRLTEASPLGIGHLIERRFVSVNRAMTRITGYSREELIGQSTRLLYFSDEDYETTGRELRAQLGAGGHAELELRTRRKDGSERWVRFFARVIDREDFRKGWAFFAEDITEERRALRALQESEERTRLLLASTGEAIYGIGLDGRCTFANAACVRMIGAEHALQLLGKNMHELIHHHRADGSIYPSEECPIYRAFREGKPAHVEDEVLFRLDGKSFPVEYWSHPMLRDGRVIGAVVTFIDITERRAQEERLRDQLALIERQNRELVAAQRAKVEFLNRMSHELRTPLNAVIGFSELLVSGIPKPLEPEQRGYAKEAFDAGTHLLHLVDDMLAYIRSDSGDMPVSAAALAPETFIDARLGAFEVEADRRSLRLAGSVAPDCPKMLADATLLRIALDNLLSNALKFTPAGGRVDVVAHAGPAGSGSVEIDVIDTGPGIAAQDLPKLFEPFQQLDGGLARKSGGAGLGLALTRRLARLQGGEVEVRSTPGTGSVFTLRLRAATAAQEKMGGESTREQGNGSG